MHLFRKNRQGFISFILFLLLLGVGGLFNFQFPIFRPSPALALSPGLQILPPQGFQAFDLPGDSGGAIGLTWKTVPYDYPDASYQIYVKELPSAGRGDRGASLRPEGGALGARPKSETGAAQAQGGSGFKLIEGIPANTHYKSDMPYPWWIWRPTREEHFYPVKSTEAISLENGKAYAFKVVLVTPAGTTLESPVQVAVPRGNLFNWAKLNNLILAILFAALILLSIRHARRNHDLFLRRIPGLDAVEEAIGRATEMGKPILYLTGSDSMSSLSTIAATVILGEVAKRAALYDTQILVPHRDPIVMAVCQEIVKEAYLEAGRPDAYREDSNFFITDDQFSYTAAVNGIMLRDRPAVHFFMGYYYAEALLLTEIGSSTGAIQIAGTDSEHQLPFFVTTCDYTLIGEELYAASAYLSREPVMVGTLLGQDRGKAFFLGVLLLGSVMATLGAVLSSPAFGYFLQLFKDFK